MAQPIIPIIPANTAVTKKEQYWAIVYTEAVKYYNKVAADQVYGRKNCKNTGILRLFKQLEFYLSIIEEKRYWDKMNDYEGQDYGSAYYITLNCIKSIRKSLICYGFSQAMINKIFTIFNLYDLISTTPVADRDGIGIMGIEYEEYKPFSIS